MAKTNADSGAATLLEEPADFYRPPANEGGATRPSRPARRKADADDDAGEPFLRSRRRVPVRRGVLPSWARSLWGKLALAAGILAVVGAAVALVYGVRSFLDRDPRFRIESSASIQTFGNAQISRNDLLSVFGSDIGRNLFFVPMAKRRAELEQIPWVQSATVMRVLPNQLRVAIVERTPIAFVEVRGSVDLVDAQGVILALTPQQMEQRHYSFPVVTGINPGDPLSLRSARMQIYRKFIGDLDSTGEHFSAHLSEVDLSDPNDVRATVAASGSDLRLHFGEENFLARWRNYQTHIAEWQQQYPHLASIDLRYEHEVVLKMAGIPDAGSAPATPARPAKAAASVVHKAPAAHRSPVAHSQKSRKSHAAKHPSSKTSHRAKVSAHPRRRPA